MSDTMVHIANCIKRIIDAECSPGKVTQRSEDLAEALRIANTDGIHPAHFYLIQLCIQAEDGKYIS